MGVERCGFVVSTLFVGEKLRYVVTGTNTFCLTSTVNADICLGSRFRDIAEPYITTKASPDVFPNVHFDLHILAISSHFLPYRRDYIKRIHSGLMSEMSKMILILFARLSICSA
jgi:hypothetical protein